MIAGGAASRFGADKAVAVWRDRPLIEHAAAALSGHVAAVAVCGRGYKDWLALPDQPRPGVGPLGGIAAALCWAADEGALAVLTIACDTPLVPPDLLDRLVEHTPAYVEQSPLLGCWPTAAAPGLLAWLERHDTIRGPSLRAWCERINARRLASEPIPNINTAADLATL